MGAVLVGVSVAAFPLSPRRALAEPCPRASAPDDKAPEGAAADAVDVCVRGTPGARREPTVAATVVPRERLEAPGVRIADVLRSVPGVQIADTGGLGAPASALVRGATASHTPVYLGGIRLNDDVAGVADLGGVPPWFLSRIEVYRGHAPIEADRLGMGGALFLEPRRPGRAELSVGVLGGSFRTQGAWVRAGAPLAGGGVLAGVAAEGSANDYVYNDDGGTLLVPGSSTQRPRPNADARVLDAWALGATTLGSVQLGVVTNAMAREQGVPRLATVPTRAARVLTQRALVGVEVTAAAPGGVVLEARGAYLGAASRYDDPLGELYLRTARLTVEGERVEQSLGARWSFAPRWLLRPVVSAAHETLVRTAAEGERLRARRIFSRAAALARWDFASGSALTGLASAECHGTAEGGAASGCDVAAPTGRLGVEHHLGPVTALATVGRYVRVPTLGELYGVADAVRGNPELRPEAAWSAEAGARIDVSFRSGGLRGITGELFVFGRAVDDLVAYRRVGMGYVVPFNVKGARLLGAELLAAARLGEHITAEVSATLLDPRDTSEGRTTTNDVLPYRSRLLLAPSARARLPLRSSWLGDAELFASYVYQSSRYVDPAGLAVLPEQGSLDLEARATFHRHLLLRARLANTLDQPRTDLVGFPLPGRSFFVSMESRL